MTMDKEAYQAVKENNAKVLARRLQQSNSVDIAACNGAGLTMLHVACYQGCLDTARVLLELGKASAHALGRDTMSTPLHLAALSGNADLVRLLLQYQARYDAQDSQGKSALHYAAVQGHLDVISVLLNAGASSKLVDNQGRAPYDYAMEKNQLDAAERLMRVEKIDEREENDLESSGDVRLTFEELDIEAINEKRRRDERLAQQQREKERERMRRQKEEEERARLEAAGGGLWVPFDEDNKGRRAPPKLPQRDKPIIDKGANDNRRNNLLGKGDGERGRVGPKKSARDAKPTPSDRRRNGSADDDDSDEAAEQPRGQPAFESPSQAKEFLEKELQPIIGMEGVKNMLRSLCRKMAVDQQRARYGFQNEQNLNMLFLGNPGTGKTSMARVVARLLRYMGILKKGHLVEVCRKDLVAEYSGQSATKTVAKVQEAMGGVLFVDEAYALKHQDSKDSFGQEVVDTLVAEMENHRKNLVVIMAGYTKEMSEFFRSNSGLQSRFPHTFEFSNYTYPEMSAIFKGMAEARKLKVGVPDDKLPELIGMAIPRSIAAKGNARSVRNLLEKVLARQTDRVADKGTTSMDSLLTLIEEDFAAFEPPAGPGGGETPNKGSAGPCNIEKVLEKLDDIVGVKSVKDLFKSLRAKLTIAEEKRKLGLPAEGASTLHMIFEGNPGTGKTTVARLMGEMFKALKLLPAGHLVEVSRVDLVGEHVGETAPKTRKVVESAIGGVLFVDEAYTLISDEKDSFGREALETIMKGMEDMRDEIIVILAGYPEQMKLLLQSNPGLKSRFPVNVSFPDYNGHELDEIAKRMLAAKQLILSKPAVFKLTELCNAQAAMNDPMSGNARFVRNLIEVACMRQAERLVALPSRSKEQLMTLEVEDLDANARDFEGTGILLAESTFGQTKVGPWDNKVKVAYKIKDQDGIDSDTEKM